MSPTPTVTPAMEGPAKPVPRLHLRPTSGWVPLRLGELWEYRDLFYFLTWRDVKVRYKQTLLGASWAVLQPMLTMVVFTVVFGRLASIPSDGVPYPLFSFAALVPWTFFSHGITQAAMSLVTSAALIRKVYFPRVITPMATILAGGVDLLIALSVLFVMMYFYGVHLTLNALWLVPLTLLAFISALGVGLWLSALNVYYRDVKHATPFLVQIWLFATPIAYPSSLLETHWRLIYGLNPMAGVVEGYRWALLGVDSQPGPLILVSVLAAFAILVSGLYFFRAKERAFADFV